MSNDSNGSLDKMLSSAAKNRSDSATGAPSILSDEERRARLSEKYGYAKAAPTHEQVVRSRLGWIAGGVWVLAGVTILNIVIGSIAATAHGL